MDNGIKVKFQNVILSMIEQCSVEKLLICADQTAKSKATGTNFVHQDTLEQPSSMANIFCICLWQFYMSCKSHKDLKK